MSPQKWIVIGANRGIGFGLVEELIASSPSDIVYATARDISKAVQLQELAESSAGRVIPTQADFNDFASLQGVVADIKRTTDSLDHVIVNAGAAIGQVPIDQMTGEELLDNCRINVVGTHHAVLALLPLVEASKSDKRSFVFMSSNASTLGLVEEKVEMINKLYDLEAYTLAGYAVSKTALNMLARQWALKLEPMGIAVPAVHPGDVATEGANYVGIPVQESAQGLVRLLKGLEISQCKNGILCYDGTILPW